MTEDKKQIENIDIEAYVDKTTDMIAPLLPNTKRRLNHNQYLQDTLLELLPSKGHNRHQK